MKRTLSPGILAILCAIIFYACQKDFEKAPSAPTEEVEIPTFSEPAIQANVNGVILDESGKALADVTVSAGGSTTHTDEHGVFSIQNTTIGEQFGFVRVDKEGYLPGSRTVLTDKSGGNFIKIQLLKKELKGTFESSQSASVDISAGTSIQFSENAIVTQAGTPYNGSVSVYGALIDPTSPNFSLTMPGDLRGLRSDNSLTALISYGMLTILLEDEAGNKLQLAPGKEAGITMTIAQKLLASAPATIPMWHFDESKGIWIEEGFGTKSGNMYVGTVSHFSTWNFDNPQDFVELTLHLSKQKLSPVPYTEVKVYQANNDVYYNTVFTDSAGRAKLWVPKSISLKMKVVGYCSETLDSMVIGPFAIDSDLGTIQLNHQPRTSIRGAVIDCTGANAENAIVKLFINGLYYTAMSDNGNFVIDVNECINQPLTGKLKAEDFGLRMQSDFTDIVVNPGLNEIGNIRICAQIQEDSIEFVKCRVGDENYTYISGLDSFAVSSIFPYTFIRVFARDPQPEWDIYSKTIFLEMPDSIPGLRTFRVMSSVTADSTTYATPFMLNNANTRYRILMSDKPLWNIEAFGNVGEMIKATFEASAVKVGDTTNKIPVTGEIRIRRRM